jgi:hypothetical protein
MAVLQRELSHARSSQHMKTWLKKWIVGEISIKRIRIIIHGRSVGAGIASHLAAKYKVADLIMESPFITAFRVRMVIPVCFRNSRYHKHYANTFNHHQDHC